MQLWTVSQHLICGELQFRLKPGKWKSGKIKQFGVSNFTPSQFDLLNSRIPLTTNQVEVSVAHLQAFQDGTLDQLLKLGVQPTAWSPLAGGIIFSGDDNKSQRIRKVATRLAEEKGCQLDQVLLAFVMKHPAGIIPVVGSSRIDRIKSAKEAAELMLSQEEWYELWVASTGEEVA